MRAHGVPNFPDPIPLKGRLVFGFTVQSGVDPNTPQFKSAFSYCTIRYHIFKHTATPAQRAQWNAEAVKFTACMHAHGAVDFPDPDGSGGIDIPSDSYLNSPKVLQAESACKSLRTGQGFVFVVPVPSPQR
jgi:hypothetical protein